MNKSINRRSPRTKKVGLILFGLLAGTLCFLLIVKPADVTITKTITNDSVRINTPLTGKNVREQELINEIDVIQKFNQFIDSLNRIKQ